MKKTNRIAWLLVGLLIVSAVLVMWVTDNIRHNVVTINEKWEALVESSTDKLATVDKLHADMGFGGLIHRYTDLIIRGGRLHIEEIHESIGSIETQLQEYAAEPITAAEQRAIIGIRSVLDTYRDNLRRVNSLLQSNALELAADKRLYVDDRAAIAGMDLLYRKAMEEAGMVDSEVGFGGLLNDLRRVLGYGGMIHFFKYYQLTRQERYRKSAKIKLQEARYILQQIDALGLGEREILAVSILRKGMESYEQALERVAQQIRQGATTRALDEASYVDENPSLTALDILKKAVRSYNLHQASQVGESLQNIMQMTRTTVGAVVALAILILAAFYWLLNVELLSLFSREKKSLEDELREMQLQLTDVLDVSPFGFVITQQQDGRILYANQAVSALYGADRSELIGRQSPEFFSDRDLRWRYIQRLQDGEVIRNEQTEFKRRDGSRLSSMLTCKLASFNKEQVVFNWIYDISDRVSAEKRLAESEQMLNTILESIPIGIGIARKESGIVEYCNNRGAELFGYPDKAGFIGKSSMLVWADQRQREEYFQTFNRLGYVPEQEIQLLKVDNYPFWALLGWESIQYRDEEHVLFWYHDISERKRMQEHLRRSEHQLRTILESAPIGVGISNKDDGTLFFCNSKAAEILHLSHREMMARKMTEFWVDVSQRDEYLRQFQEMGEVPEREIEVRRADGSQFWALLGWKSIMIQGVEQILFWIYDYDELKQTTLALEHATLKADQANRAKSIFFSNMSHELRTPMNSVIGFAQMMEADPREPLTAKQDKCVRHIIKAGRHLLGLINEILDLSRIEAGKIDFCLESVAVKDLVNDCLDLIAPLIEQHRIEVVRLDTASVADCYIKADQMRLKQVLINLLTNGVKYNAGKRQLGIGWWATANGTLRVFVADTGIGIPPERIDEIFTLYRRLNAGGDGIEGSGIGLSITRKLIEEMGGHVGVESQPDRGSVFWFELSLVTGVAQSGSRRDMDVIVG
ncbi:PAS domain S-box protein [Sedimenticola sp.]|uniref:PAS domain S-box protein n=1 Tax=Sedimenticola sp. TaxID=1940285 RepID=UPI003D0DBF47